MTTYWCVNFDSEACLEHGIDKNIWMMQYQYADDHGNVFQGGNKKSATTLNWRRLKNISDGDWFVAYLPRDRTVTGNTFFAIGKARMPRRSYTSGDHKSTVEQYVIDQKSHNHSTGYVYYEDALVFYEDFTDKWRAEDHVMRYAQRIDVEKWQHYVPAGVPWVSNLKIRPFEIQRAFFEIRDDNFDTIMKTLSAEQGTGDPTGIVDESVVDALEKSDANSQGFLLDSKTRKALESHAMNAAKRYFTSLGYVVEDHSKNQSYDLKCVGKKRTLYVEVKGTQTNGKGVILTYNEVEFARSHKGQMALFVLHSINVSENKETLTNGQRRLILPWNVDDGHLKPVSFTYEVPTSLC